MTITQRPQFSILVPFHNSADTIAETIASVKAQTGAACEIIIADDRSSAEARDALERLTANDPSIRVVNSAGPGPSAARNTAASYASGAYLCFLDADDCLRPNALRTFADAFLSSPEAGVLFGRVRITASPKHDGGVITPHCPSPSLEQIIGENRICTSSNIVARREAFEEIGGFNEALTHAEDQEWLARAYCSRWSMRGLGTVTLDYRTTPGGLSSDLAKMERGWRAMIASFEAAGYAVDRQEKARAKAMFYRYLARRALRMGSSRFDAARFSIRAAAAAPLISREEARRTLATHAGALAVAAFGARPFQRFFA